MSTPALGLLAVILLFVYGVTAASLLLTRKLCDEAYFRRPLAHGKVPWLAHIPTYALMLYGTLYLVGALTGFPYTLTADAGQFWARNAFGIWTLAMTLSQTLSALSLFSIVGVPLFTWVLTQRVPERSAAARLQRTNTPGHAPRRPLRALLGRRTGHHD